MAEDDSILTVYFPKDIVLLVCSYVSNKRKILELNNELQSIDKKQRILTAKIERLSTSNAVSDCLVTLSEENLGCNSSIFFFRKDGPVALWFATNDLPPSVVTIDEDIYWIGSFERSSWAFPCERADPMWSPCSCQNECMDHHGLTYRSSLGKHDGRRECIFPRKLAKHFKEFSTSPDVDKIDNTWDYDTNVQRAHVHCELMGVMNQTTWNAHLQYWMAKAAAAEEEEEEQEFSLSW